jgi:glycerol-3-phosphate acyltransferase PlsY
MLISIIGTLLIAYLLGSIPFGLLLTRALGLGDIRTIGSGNIGATNVMRTGKKGLGITVLLLDAVKGLVAVWLAQYLYNENIAPAAGLAAVFGHVFPIWLKFKGGKGVATTLGVFFALNPVFCLAVCILWLAIFSITRTSSISSLIAMGYAPIITYVMDGNFVVGLLCLNLAVLIVFTHRGNIRRLLSGGEHRFQKRKSDG